MTFSIWLCFGKNFKPVSLSKGSRWLLCYQTWNTSASMDGRGYVEWNLGDEPLHKQKQIWKRCSENDITLVHRNQKKSLQTHYGNREEEITLFTGYHCLLHENTILTLTRSSWHLLSVTDSCEMFDSDQTWPMKIMTCVEALCIGPPNFRSISGACLNIKMPSYQYRDPFVNGKTVARPSDL